MCLLEYRQQLEQNYVECVDHKYNLAMCVGIQCAC